MPHHIAVDNGMEFIDNAFKAALADLGIDHSVMPAGVAKLRAFIERLFRTFVTRLMPFLTGRTFSNPVERGDYPSEAYAVHTGESIARILTRFIVDIYHNEPHSGLEYASPANAWARLCQEYGRTPAPSKHRLRHVLGSKIERDLGRHGITHAGINYHSEALARYFQRSAGQRLQVSIDPEDMGHVSVWFNDAWLTVPSVLEGMDGVSAHAWQAAMREIRRNNREHTRSEQDIVDQAHDWVRQYDRDQRAKRQLGSTRVSQDEIIRAREESFYGFIPAREAEDDPDRRGSFLSDMIIPAPAQPFAIDTDPHTETDPGESPRNPSTPRWRFSDDID